MDLFHILYFSIVCPCFLGIIILLSRFYIKLKRMEKILLDTAKRSLTKEEYLELLNLINKI